MLRELWRLEGHGVFLCPEPQRVVIATSLFTAFRSIPSPGIHTWPHRVRLDPSSLPTWALVAPVSVHKDSAWSVFLPTSVALSSWPPGFPRMSLPFYQDNFPWRFLQGKSAPQIPAFFLRTAFTPQGGGCCFNISFTALQILSHFWALWFLRRNLSSDLVFELKRSLARSLCCRGLWDQF